MDKSYTAGGTMRKCPYTGSPEIVTFTRTISGVTFDRSKCPHHSECTDDSCPLCAHLES